jgi:predicted nuclease of predicted toxin-antitoxin system
LRFLLDENISPLVAGVLNEGGHDAVHARDVGLLKAPDEIVFSHAVEEGRVVVSGDTDFGRLLIEANVPRPSLILFRREDDRRAATQAGLILSNLDQVKDDLEAGAIVVIEPHRVRVRRLTSE